MNLPNKIIEMNQYKKEISISEQLNNNRSLLNKIIKRKEAIIKFKGEPLFYERTINMIQGTYGSHKSRLAGHIASVLIGVTEIIGMQAEKKYHVLYCDTERDTEDELPIDMKNIINLSNADDKHFNFITFYDIERNGRSKHLQKVVTEVKRIIGGKHLIVFVDVVTDFISDFNSLSATNEFIDFTNKLIKDLNCTLFLVIHENPSKDNNKARGHVGTELGNKSNTVLSIRAEDEDSGLYKIKMLKQRRAKKLKNIYVKYSEDFKGLVLANTVEISESLSGIKLKMEDFTNFIIEFMKDSEQVSQQNIISGCMERFEVSDKTAFEKFKELRGNTMLLNEYELEQIKGEKNRNYFRLISKENELPI